MTLATDSAAARTILVVEDEAPIADAVAARLRSEGFGSRSRATVPPASTRCAELHPDLVVLDLMLPGLDGLEVCERIQADRPVPVLMLTARDSEHDLLVGLGVGADDYMTKPFSTRELVARIHALLRRVDRGRQRVDRRSGQGSHRRRCDHDRSRRPARPRDGDLVHLTPTEFDLVAVPRRVHRRGVHP